MAGRELANL
ncbi:hypothetical protein D018_3569A, partial [Vibrio parahaemolyticus VP2007-007]